MSLRQTVELVRVATSMFEQQLPELAEDDAERAVLIEASLRYSREVAFAAARVYAGVAEARGAWDARLEALVVDGIMRGDGEESLLSRATALGLEPAAPAPGSMRRACGIRDTTGGVACPVQRYVLGHGRLGYERA